MIDLYSNIRWSTADIMFRTQSIIRQTVSVDDELKAARLVRKLNPSEEEQAFVERVDRDIKVALVASKRMKEDAVLLNAALDHEQGIAVSTDTAVLELVALRIGTNTTGLTT